MNIGPPPGSIFQLDGMANPGAWTQYTTDAWLATTTATNMTFAFREDPSFIFLDDVTVHDVTANTDLTVVNGGFEDGPVGDNAPTGWTYLNQYGATFGGVVTGSTAHSGSNSYIDGAVQAYDAITQVLTTIVDHQYTISFWVYDGSGLSTFRALSDNGQEGTGGNANNIAVYAGVGVPPPTVPEPSTMALLSTGLAAMSLFARRRSRGASK
jgi:hypothetical protein